MSLVEPLDEAFRQVRGAWWNPFHDAFGFFCAACGEKTFAKMIDGQIRPACGCRFEDACGDNHQPEDQPATSHNGASPRSSPKAPPAAAGLKQPIRTENGTPSSIPPSANRHKPSKGKLPYAVAYARRGMAVFPLHNIESDRECSCAKLQCSSAGKHPRLSDWQSLATRDEAQLAAWWEQWTQANIGVKCGRESDLTVLDVDGDLGRETLRDLEMEHGELPETPIAITGSGGAHFYFKFEQDVGNAVRFAPGLDVRTEGGLVVGVGSVTKRPYMWEEAFKLGELAPARMPTWLAERIKAAGPARTGNKLTVPENLHTLTEGSGRNDLLYRLGRSMKAKHFPSEAIRAALDETNKGFAQPLDGDEFGGLVQHLIVQPDRPAFQAPVPNGNGAAPALSPLPAPMKAGEWFVREKERFANTTYIWDGVLEVGSYAMIGGKKGHGKSTFARTLAFKISRGEEFMGRPTVRSKVWYLDFEPGGRGRVDTLEKLGWCDEDWLEFSTIPPPVNHPDVFKWLRQYIVERGFKVIVADTLFKLLKIDGANDYDKALYAQIPLEEICRELGVCIIVLHHARKNGQFSSQQSCAEQMLGATSIAGAACACVLINHRGGSYTFRMDPPRYGTAIEGELILQLDTQGFVADCGTWKRRWVSEVKKLVMEAVSAHAGWFVPGDLQQVVDPEKGEPLNRRSLYWALGELVKDGLLEKGQPLKTSRRGGKPVTPYRALVGFSGVEATPPASPLQAQTRMPFPSSGNRIGKNDHAGDGSHLGFDDNSRDDPNGIDWSK